MSLGLVAMELWWLASERRMDAGAREARNEVLEPLGRFCGVEEDECICVSENGECKRMCV